MSALPWYPDRSLTPQDARAAIATCFPDVDAQSAKHLATGWEFDVYLTDDGWVFRFPRQGWIAGVFEPERRAHDLVAPILAPNIRVPRVELVGKPTKSFPYEFAGHRFIEGVPADDVSRRFDATLASDIGKALEAIHSIPVEKARAAGILELDLEDPGRRDWLTRGVERAPRLRGLDPAADPGLEWLAATPVPMRKYEGPLCFTHTDMSSKNLIVDPRTGRLTGILDWTDTMLEDRAGDFARLVTWRGWDFAEEVLRSYRLPLEGDFRDRIDFAARLRSTVVLTEAHAHGMDVAEYIDGVRNAFAI